MLIWMEFLNKVSNKNSPRGLFFMFDLSLVGDYNNSGSAVGDKTIL